MFGRAVIVSRALSRVSRSFATEGSGASAMKLSLCTPHETIYHDKVIDKVILPGEQGEYGVTVGHSPIISQLKPGVVSVIHEGGETEKFFVSGGFAVTNAESVTDVSVTEAVALEELDEAAVKSGYADAMKAKSSAEAGSAEAAKAQVEETVYTSMARALGVAL